MINKVVIIFIIIFSLSSSAFADTFTLSSKDIKNNQSLNSQQEFNAFGCTGENISPELSWKNPPTGTKSFALTVYDPDAPTGSGWWHWVVFNIPTDISSLPAKVTAENLPKGAVESNTDFGTPGFGGACPPKGDTPHRYIFTIYALDVEKLDGLNANSPAAMVGYNINGHKLGEAKITATYQK